MIKKIISFLFFLLVHVVSFATTYYVAPDGKDTNPGTKARPFQTLQKAQSFAAASRRVPGIPDRTNQPSSRDRCRDLSGGRLRSARGAS